MSDVFFAQVTPDKNFIFEVNTGETVFSTIFFHVGCVIECFNKNVSK